MKKQTYPGRNEYWNKLRTDHFTVLKTADDFLREDSKFNPKVMAAMALDGLIANDSIVSQHAILYCFYNGALYEVDSNWCIRGSEDDPDPLPSLVPMTDGEEKFWWEPTQKEVSNV